MDGLGPEILIESCDVATERPLWLPGSQCLNGIDAGVAGWEDIRSEPVDEEEDYTCSAEGHGI